jgi:hypothetical protein
VEELGIAVLGTEGQQQQKGQQQKHNGFHRKHWGKEANLFAWHFALFFVKFAEEMENILFIARKNIFLRSSDQWGKLRGNSCLL